jgi:hypothetical protein
MQRREASNYLQPVISLAGEIELDIDIVGI